MCLIEFSHRKELGVKFLGSISMNYSFLLAWIGMLISNLIILIQSDKDSNKI